MKTNKIAAATLALSLALSSAVALAQAAMASGEERGLIDEVLEVSADHAGRGPGPG